MLTAIKLLRAAAVELLGAALVLFLLGAFRPDLLQGALESLDTAAKPAAAADPQPIDTPQSAAAKASLLDDWRWLDDAEARSQFVARRLAASRDSLLNAAAEHVDSQWEISPPMESHRRGR